MLPGALTAIFGRERDRYVKYLAEARDEIAASKPAVVAEILISINNEAIPYPYRYLRIDVLSAGPDGRPQPHEVQLSNEPSFEARSYDLGACVVEVYPFTWDSVQFLADRPFPDLREIEGWITRRLDLEDKNSADGVGFGRAIHSFTQVGHSDRWWYITGDFGSAPADALVEFIELLAGQGLPRIIIKSGRADGG